jgi:cysteine protease ATG4
METSSVELGNMMASTDNRMMTLSMHEEQATSSESYLNAQTPNSDEEQFDRAIEPAEETGQDVAGNYEDGIDGFKKDFISRLWMTYRRDFAIMPVEPSNANGGYTSDCGWGCMIRSGQMMLAQALVIHFLGRSWRFDPDSQIYSTAEDHIHRRIARWFGDQVSKNSPFSIHALVELGKASGKKVGEWYGPGAVAHLIKQAVKQSARENLDLAAVHVYVAQDCTIYNQDVFDECYSQENQAVPWKHDPHSHKSLSSPSHAQRKITTWKSLILLIPLRLGHEKLNPIYGDCLKAMLSLEWCIGIIGGRPKHSLFFVGYQDDKLIHLDPHYCQDMVDVNAENFSLSSFHCKSARKMKISKMDPSCCLGFYISSKNDYDRFQISVQPYLLPVKNYSERRQQQNCMAPQTSYGLEYNYPMFVFSAGRIREQNMERMVARNNFPSTGTRSSRSNQTSDEDDDGIEDFVMI